ncbi:50S ribosomal protein L3 [Xylocopilactobacillus apicola]|uniref:Large ribosomal subunit protein uL3 n=1 Tax=Xylocopilactobacillus apicola TaxID=2932184 RepID=A0AAU9DTQ3_9LACO|nr:50S ribosomal protein L3 [Xylocopilactobacillus apicola]BDR59539.1 50S ribosomal protein L3 [Xylocopilactobacillus apicola]
MATKAILGQKIGMTQIFDENGELIPVSVIDVTPNTVLQVKTKEHDGYDAVQLGTGAKRDVLSNKPEQGHVKKAQAKPKRFVKEIRNFELGDGEFGSEELTINVEQFAAGELVDVTGVSKGHGFQGNIKKDNQSRGPETHGSRYHRIPGSMGAIINRVFPGKKLPGRMGNHTVTMQNLVIAKIDPERNLLLIKGNVPGANKSFVTVKNAVKAVAK